MHWRKGHKVIRLKRLAKSELWGKTSFFSTVNTGNLIIKKLSTRCICGETTTSPSLYGTMTCDWLAHDRVHQVTDKI